MTNSQFWLGVMLPVARLDAELLKVPFCWSSGSAPVKVPLYAAATIVQKLPLVQVNECVELSDSAPPDLS
jgi:hypothetical protein